MKQSVRLSVLACLVLTVSGSLPAADNTWLGKSPAWEAAENWSAGVAPTGDVAAVIPGGLTNEPWISKPVALDGILRIEKGATVMASGAVSVKPGKLQIAEGGRLWLGVARSEERVVDIALKIEGPVPADAMPVIFVSPAPSNMPSVVTRMTNDVGPAVPDSQKLVNIAPFAEIRTLPYMAMARTLVDPDAEYRTAAIHEIGTPAKGIRYQFHFPKVQTIAGVQWAVVVGPWAILADTTGNGQYDTLLRMDLEGRLSNPGGVWRSRAVINNRFWPPVKAYGIQIVSLLSQIMDNRIYDVQILCPKRSVKFKDTRRLERGVAEIQTNQVVTVAAPPVEQQFLKGFHIEPWMFDAPGWIKLNPRPPLSQYAGFTNFVNGVKRMHGNVVNMWPPTTFETKGPGEYESDLLWPSQYDRHSVSENLLKLIAEACHGAGIKLFVMQRNAYPKKLEEFPVTDTSKLEAAGINRHAREYLAGVAREQAASGVDGVGIGFDEQAAWGLVTSLKQKDPFTRKAFEERFKVPFPEEPADTEAFRKWVVFAYEQFAAYLQGASSAAKAANPKVLIKTPVHMSLGTLWNDRIKVGIAEDIVGHTADIDFIRANGYEDGANIRHYIAAASTKRMIAANRTRGADVLLNCPWANDPVQLPGYYLDFTPAYMAGSPLSHIMNGGQMPLYWRYNFIFYGGYDQYVEQAYSILDTLAAWGGKDAKVPRHIAVLKSRASEDWWQIRQQYGKDGNPMDQTRGYLYEKWLLEFLFTSGYPFEMYYLDQPKDFAADLSQYAVVLLPFPYSLSKEAFDAVRHAAEKGTKIVVFDRKGETDEWGTPYPQPLFAEMIAGSKATFIADDLPAVGHYPDVLSKFQASLDTMLGSRKPIDVNTYGNDVEVSLLEKGPKERFVCLINWADQPVKVDIGLRDLPDGRYEMLQRDLREVRKVKLSGKEELAPAALKKFRVGLERWEIKLLYVRPFPEAGGR